MIKVNLISDNRLIKIDDIKSIVTYQNKNISKMGCHQQYGPVHDPNEIYKTAFGIVTVKLLNIHLYSIEGNHDKMGKQFFAKLKVTNQSKTSKNVLPSQFNNINYECQFAINSRHLQHGRALNIQVYERGSIIQASLVGTGTLDLNFVLNEKDLEKIKIYLVHKNNKVGWVEVNGQFLPCNTNVITIMFDNVILRRKTSFGTMYCQIKTEIGQQSLYTSVSQDKKDQPANWKGEIFTFYYLKDFQKEGTITIYDGETVIGSMILNLEEFQQAAQSQIQIKESFYFQQEVAGTLKFIISKGQQIHKTSFLTRSAVVSPSKKKPTPFDKSKLQITSKLQVPHKQQPLKDSQTHKVNLNQSKKVPTFVQIKKQDNKVQQIKKPQIIKEQKNIQPNDKSMTEEKKNVNQNPYNSKQLSQVKSTPKQIENKVHNQSAKNITFKPPQSQLKKEESNVLGFQGQTQNNKEPNQPIVNQQHLQLNKQIKETLKEVKQEAPPNLKKSDQIEIGQTKMIEIKSLQAKIPVVQAQALNLQQNNPRQTNQQSLILNK